MRRCGLIIALLLAGGCISEDNGVSKDATAIVIGETTRRAVITEWGNPDLVYNDVWIWRESRCLGGKVKASYWGVGATIKNLSYAIREYHIRFDAEGKVRSAETIDYTPDKGEWSINPWN